MKCNSTLSDEYISEVPLWNGGLTFHHVGLIICAAFGLIATCIGLSLIFMHATHYLKPWEQRHIIRILLLIPIYSVVSFLSYLYYRHAIYYDILEGAYEAFAISSFFILLCHYIAPNLHDQKDFFRTMSPIRNWFWGVFGLQYCTGGENKGPFRKPRSGLTWFNLIWVGIFQYCFVRVLFSIVAVLAQIGDVYCEDSLSPAFAHVWVQCFEAVSVTIAMFCVIQFYLQLKDELAEHKPFLKVLCIKLVIFFSFWQTIVISFLSSAEGPLQPTKTLAYPDIRVGIPSVLLCIEMAIFAVLHIFAFSWKPYSIKHSYSDPLREPGSGFSGSGDSHGQSVVHYKGFWYALGDAFNPWDIIKMTARGFRWLFVGYRKRELDSSYQDPNGKLGLHADTGYGGPTYANTGEPATEMQPPAYGGSVPSRVREDDRAGLLGNAYSTPPHSAAYSEVDLSAPNKPPRPPYPTSPMDFDSKPSDFNNDDDDVDEEPPYHPNMGPAAGAGRADRGGAVHPVFRVSGGSADWPLSRDADAFSRSSRDLKRDDTGR